MSHEKPRQPCRVSGHAGVSPACKRDAQAGRPRAATAATAVFRFFGQLLVLFVSFAVVTGCGRPPSSARLADELKSCASWAATAQMIGDSWLRNAIPRAYAGDSLRAAREDISTAIETARKAGRADAVEALQRLEKDLGAMTDALEKQDRATLGAQLKSLAAQKEQLAALEKSLASRK